MPLLQCLVLAAAPSRQSPENSPVSQSNAPEASSLSTHKKDVSFSGAPVPNSVSPGIELVFYCSLTLLVDSNSTGFKFIFLFWYRISVLFFCDSSDRFYFNRFLILFLIFLHFYFTKYNISCISIKDFKRKSTSSPPYCTSNDAIWCALICSIYVDNPLLSFIFSFQKFKLNNHVGSFLF